MSVSRKLDKFYTKPGTVQHCLSFLDREQYDCVVEPSAGSGAWSLQFENCIAIDIHPEHPSIRRGDFLEIDLSSELKGKQRVMVVGNPPFGRQCSLAVRFFNRSASYPQVHTIAMILPPSFRKISIQKRLHLAFHLEQDFSLTAPFLLDGKDYDVPSIFQVWSRRSTMRLIPSMPVLTTSTVQFISKPKIRDEDTVVSVRRVGFYAGRSYSYEGQNSQTHYFLLVREGSAEQVISHLNQIEWEYGDTTGPRSISKRQLIPVLNQL